MDKLLSAGSTQAVDMAGISHNYLHLCCSTAGRELEEIASAGFASQRRRGDSGSAAQQKDPTLIEGRFWTLPLLVVLLSAAIPALISAQANASTTSSLMGRIRTFLGVQPRSLSVGGTLSSIAQSVCLLVPGPVETSGSGSSVRVLDPGPALVLGTSLNEIEIRRGATVLWSQLASSKAPISGSITWPLAPMAAGEHLELAMRPKGAAGGDWGVVKLQAASAEAQQRYANDAHACASSVELRLQQLDHAIAAGLAAEAQALLWAPLNPSSSALKALQLEQKASCEKTPTIQK